MPAMPASRARSCAPSARGTGPATESAPARPPADSRGRGGGAHVLQPYQLFLDQSQLLACQVRHVVHPGQSGVGIGLAGPGRAHLLALLLGLRDLANLGQRKAEQVLEPLDALEVLNIVLAVETVAALGASGGREQADLFVVAQGALGEAGARGNLLDAPEAVASAAGGRRLAGSVLRPVGTCCLVVRDHMRVPPRRRC